jgi:hypothetical protein
VPLYILLVIKNILERCTIEGRFDLSASKFETAVFFDEINDYAIMVLLAMIVLSVLYLKMLLRQTEGTHYYSIVDIEDQTGNVYFNYISIYLLSCLGLTLSSIVDVFVLLFLMLIVGYIYISNHMTYMNPLLQLLGYKVYEGTVHSDSTNKDFQSIIIAPKNLILQKGQTYTGSGKEDFIFISD